MDREKLVDELGDVAWYIALGCTAIGVGLEDVLEANISKLRRRYPNGFDAKCSINRQE